MILRLRSDDFGRITRSHTMPRATASTAAILAAARGLVAAAAPLIAERGLTLLGFAVSNIDRSAASSWSCRSRTPDSWRLDAAVDRVRRRFGTSAVTRGVLVGRDPGLEVPHLPDRKLSGDESGEKDCETADLADDGRELPGSTRAGMFELVGGVTLHAMRDVGHDRDDEEEHHNHRRGQIHPT